MDREAVTRSAIALAERRYKSRLFRGAFVAGTVAALDGQPEHACPYARTRESSWGRAWRAAWVAGHRHGSSA